MMGIASSQPKSGRDAPCHTRNRSAQASTLSSVPALDMAFDTKIARADGACETQVESSVDQTALRLDTAGPDNRLIHPRCGSSNKER